MRQIRLFLNGVEVELNEDVSFVLNQYFEDTSKPTLKYITFSKTVSIPFTLNNNRLFGGIYSPDRIITYDNTGDFTNIHFDPYKKIDMRLQNDNDVLMVGYAKMLSVDWDGEKGVYNLNLYGELGKVFGELSKVTFDNTNIKGVPIRIELKGGRQRNMNQNNNSFSNGPRRFRRRVQFRRRRAQSANNNRNNNSNFNNRQRRNRNNSNRRGQRRYKTYNQY